MSFSLYRNIKQIILTTMNIDEIVNTCLSNMKASEDFNDSDTVLSIKGLLSCIIENPSIVLRSSNEERLSIAISNILVSEFPSNYPIFNGTNVRNLVFACSFYLFMHQLDRGKFYGRMWPAFICLIHYGRSEFAKFIIDKNPFAPEKIAKLTGQSIDSQRSIKAAKGLELNLMLAAKDKDSWCDELSIWYDELFDDKDELLASDPFRKEALPLYEIITNYLKDNDVSFVNI